LLGHIETVALDAGSPQNGSVQSVDRTLSVQLREATGLEGSIVIAQQHDGPVLARGMLIIGVVTRLNRSL